MAKNSFKQTQIPFTFSKEFQEEQKAESKPKPTQEQQIIIQQEEQTLIKKQQLILRVQCTIMYIQ